MYQELLLAYISSFPCVAWRFALSPELQRCGVLLVVHRVSLFHPCQGSLCPSSCLGPLGMTAGAEWPKGNSSLVMTFSCSTNAELWIRGFSREFEIMLWPVLHILRVTCCLTSYFDFLTHILPQKWPICQWMCFNVLLRTALLVKLPQNSFNERKLLLTKPWEGKGRNHIKLLCFCVCFECHETAWISKQNSCTLFILF